MAQYGRYDPENPENTSLLFSFQEVPLTSAKVNRWNGNLVSVFELFHQVCSTLFAKNNSAVIASGNDTALKIQAADVPDMTVKTQPGWAVIQQVFAGILEAQSLPVGGVFSAPATNPRIDVVALSDKGALEVIQGTESATPSAPGVPNDSLALAHIFQRVGATQILDSDNGTDSYILDVRPRFLSGEAHLHNNDRMPVQSPDGITLQFSTQHVYRAGTLDVFLNGVLQEKDVDYTEDSNRQGYTFLQAPLAQYRIQHRYIVDYEVV